MLISAFSSSKGISKTPANTWRVQPKLGNSYSYKILNNTLANTAIKYYLIKYITLGNSYSYIGIMLCVLLCIIIRFSYYLEVF